MTPSRPPTVVRCPTCTKRVVWSEEARWRPFCSHRCRLIDLGMWADESHRIPGEKVDLDTCHEDTPDRSGSRRV